MDTFHLLNTNPHALFSLSKRGKGLERDLVIKLLNVATCLIIMQLLMEDFTGE